MCQPLIDEFICHEKNNFILQGKDIISTTIGLSDGGTIIPISEETIPEIGNITIDGTMVSPLPINNILAVELTQKIINEMEIELENNTVNPIDGDTTPLPHGTPHVPMLSQSQPVCENISADDDVSITVHLSEEIVDYVNAFFYPGCDNDDYCIILSHRYNDGTLKYEVE